VEAAVARDTDRGSVEAALLRQSEGAGGNSVMEFDERVSSTVGVGLNTTLVRSVGVDFRATGDTAGADFGTETVGSSNGAELDANMSGRASKADLGATSDGSVGVQNSAAGFGRSVCVISAGGLGGGMPLSFIISQLADEIRLGGFECAVFDFGKHVTARHIALANKLSSAILPCQSYVAEQFGEAVPTAGVLISTALSGGSLMRHIAGSISKFGAGRIALECQRLQMEFALPCRSGIGSEVSKIDAGRVSFFSEALCAKYYVRTSENGDFPRLILFDDAETIQKKLALTETFGIGNAFLFAPQIAGIQDSLNLHP